MEMNPYESPSEARKPKGNELTWGDVGFIVVAVVSAVVVGSLVIGWAALLFRARF